MPPIYGGECTNCGFRTPEIVPGYDAIYLGAPTAPDNDYAHPDDRRFVVLGHPLEGYILQDTGYTYRSATFEGRLVHYRCYYCKSCGRDYEVRRLGADTTMGCVPAIAVGIATGIGVGIWKASFILGAVAIYFGIVGGYLLFASGIRAFVRLTHANHVAEVDTKRRCPECGSRRAANPEICLRRLPCPRCHQRCVRISVVAVS